MYVIDTHTQRNWDTTDGMPHLSATPQAPSSQQHPNEQPQHHGAGIAVEIVEPTYDKRGVGVVGIVDGAQPYSHGRCDRSTDSPKNTPVLFYK